MKNLSLVLNAILLVAVAVLFYLHFAGKKTESATDSSVPTNLTIAYVNSDSVSKNYEYVTVSSDKLNEKAKKYQMDLQGRAQTLQGEIESYQRTAGTLTQAQARAVEEDLGKKRQNLQLYEQNLSQQMQIDQEAVLKDLYDRVTNYLKIYGKEKGIQVVLKYNASSDLLYANPALDVSGDVVKGLNELYKAELANPKKDSTDVKKK